LSDGGRVELSLGSGAGELSVGWNLDELRAEALRAEASPWSFERQPAEPPPLLRVLSAALDDGTALGLASAMPPGSAGHGDEEVGAFVVRPGRDPEPIAEALLSTEYDAEGRVRRAGLELWTGESGPPARGAADREVTGVAVTRGALAGEAVPMAFRLDGVEGVAVYELLRPAGSA
jgi:hypothetical protein